MITAVWCEIISCNFIFGNPKMHTPSYFGAKKLTIGLLLKLAGTQYRAYHRHHRRAAAALTITLIGFIFLWFMA